MPSPQSTNNPYRRLLGYFLPYKHLFLLGLLCTVVVAGIETTFLWLIKDVVGATIENQPGRLNLMAVAIVGLHVVKWFFSYGQSYVISSATQRVAIRLRNELYAHLQSLSLSFFEKTRTGHLMSRMTNDIGLVQNAAPQIIQVVKAPLVVVGCVATIFYWNWRLALMSVVLLPFMSYTVTKISRGMRSLTELLQIRLADVAAIVQETLSAVRVVKSFGMEDYEIEKFRLENQRTYQSAMRAVRRNAVLTPTLEVIGVTGIAFVLWYGGNMVAREAIPGFGTQSLIAFLFALERISAAAKDVARINVTYHQTMAGATRIFDVLDEDPEVRERPDALELHEVCGRVEFSDVTFSYDGKNPVLHDVSFVMEPGQQVALVGPSGSGKSTIANLIPRFYDVDSGVVTIDGSDVKLVTLSSLRQHIGIVPQESILFSTTIRENIAYGRMDASEEEIIEAARAANAHDFIEKLPQGYQTLVGERGARLSGGERQRVAIARALLKNPRLLILDEATSSLDVASESIVQEALERLMQERTTLVIAHRLSTIVNADRILVMQSGRIVEAGTHDQLISQNGLYRELYAMQSRHGVNGALFAEAEG